MEISPKILKAAQDIAIGSKPDSDLTAEELESAMQLSKMIFCSGCQ